jgi:hypothetical protein
MKLIMQKEQKIESVLNLILAYEMGELDGNETLELFGKLVKNGMAWTLQGSYGRIAHSLIEVGFLDRNGNITRKFEEDEG